MKFKVGDRVMVREWNDMVAEFGTDSWGNIETKDVNGSVMPFVIGMKHLCGRTATITAFTGGDLERINLDFDDKSGDTCWCYVESMLESEIQQMITITRNGAVVKAVDSKSGLIGEAKCSPDDKFDFEIGAKLAIDRLFDAMRTRWEGRFVCIESEVQWWKVGKIYATENGIVTADDGDTYGPFANFDHLQRELCCGKYIQIVE